MIKNKLIDITGNRYGRLTVLKRNGSLDGKPAWECICDCGNVITARGYELKRGHKISCGCYRVDNPPCYKHGLTETKLMRKYYKIKSRCYSENDPGYINYGARNIKMCDEWFNDPVAFYRWAIENGYDEDAPFKDCSIDRIDVNGNYSPDNCRFVDAKTQANNRRNNIRYDYDGKSLTIPEWSELLGIKKETLYNRINTLGWSAERAFSTPVA